LFQSDPEKVVRTFTEAVKTVDPQKAVGKAHILWIKFAQYYESHDSDLENARVIFEKATKVNYRGIDDLASVWCAWVEMELSHHQWKQALQVARQAVQPCRNADRESVQGRLHKSVKLWSLSVDVEESIGTIDTVRSCYEYMMDLKTITAQQVLNWARYTAENKFFEESFKVYERGVNLFKWPHVNDIWLIYLTEFVSRYGGKKLERARELFEQAVVDVPPQFARRLFLLYGKLEEEFGLAKRALAIYERATRSVLQEEKFDMYSLYIAKTTELFGVTKTRTIYEAAIEALPENRVKDICIRYASTERSLGEIDRARAIYQHTAQFCDPKKEQEFWKEWREFEIAHGNEDTFRDMLRIKRSVQAQHTQVHFNAAELVADAVPALPLDPMAAAEAELKKQIQESVPSLDDVENDERIRKKAQEEADVKEAEEEYRQLQLKRQKKLSCVAATETEEFDINLC